MQCNSVGRYSRTLDSSYFRKKKDGAVNVVHQNSLKPKSRVGTSDLETTTPSPQDSLSPSWTRQQFLKLSILGGVGVISTVVVSQINEDDLRSERGISYAQLRDLLKAQNWREADKETRQLLLQWCWRNPSEAWEVNGQYNEEKFRQSIDQIPCRDLHTIDQLWVEYSNGRFGFSVQKNIYLDIGGNLDGEKHETEWNKFATTIGWAQVNYNTNDMTYSISAPRGHLPICLWFGAICFCRIAPKLERCKSAA